MQTLKKVKQQVQNTKTVELVDRYIEIDRQIKELEKIKEELRDKLLELPNGTYAGTKGKLTITEQTRVTLDNLKVHSKIGTEAYLLISSVSTEKYKKLLGAIDEDDITDIKIVRQIKVVP